jgi:hypothetical protein
MAITSKKPSILCLEIRAAWEGFSGRLIDGVAADIVMGVGWAWPVVLAREGASGAPAMRVVHHRLAQCRCAVQESDLDKIGGAGSSIIFRGFV